MKNRTVRPGLVAAVAFAKAKDNDEGELAFTLPEDLTALSDEELAKLIADADAAFDVLEGEAKTDAVLEAMEGLVEAKELLNAEADTRSAAAAERDAKAAELAARMRPVAEVEDAADEAEVSDEDAAEVVAEAEAIVEAEVDLPVAAAAEPTLTASAPRRRPSRITLPASGAQRAQAAAVASAPFAAMANVPGLHPGQRLGKEELKDTINQAFRGVSKASVANALRTGQRFSQRYALAQIDKPGMGQLLGPDSTEAQIEEAYKAATDQSRLPGGSLLASGGWCAPSETSYDMCELESRDGLLSIPEMNISRGGLRFTKGLDWSTILSTTGFCFTEADDIAGDYDPVASGVQDKPVDTIPCPVFEEVRLEVCGLIVNGGNLQNRAYPEVTRRYVDMVLTGHFHRVATNVIADIVAGSTPVTHALLTGQTGAASPVLSAIELQVEDLKYKNRMARSTVFEAIFPYWVKGVIRADLAMRNGIMALDVSDAMIDAWFRQRGINPQYVYNWQNLGGAAATAWPTSLQFLVYPAGTWVKGTSDIITIEMLHDSTLNAQNNYTALFTEEGYSTMKMCFESRVVTVTICPNGFTNNAATAVTCA